MNYECDVADGVSIDVDNDVGDDVAMMLTMSFVTLYGSEHLQIISLHTTLLMHGNKSQT
jgi:hypothetical protein